MLSYRHGYHRQSEVEAQDKEAFFIACGNPGGLPPRRGRGVRVGDLRTKTIFYRERAMIRH